MSFAFLSLKFYIVLGISRIENFKHTNFETFEDIIFNTIMCILYKSALT